MKRILIHPHVLAAFLQLAPLLRVAQSAPGVMAAPTLFILRWVFGAAAVAGSFHGLSGATGVVPAAVRATNGVRTSVTFSITSSSHGTARSYSAVSGLPPGTTLSTRGTFTGTPTASGPFTPRIRGWETTSLGAIGLISTWRSQWSVPIRPRSHPSLPTSTWPRANRRV